MLIVEVGIREFEIILFNNEVKVKEVVKEVVIFF